MTTFTPNSNDDSDAALSNIEAAIKKFEQIIFKRITKAGRRTSAQRAGITVAKSLIDLIAGAKTNSRSPDFNLNTASSNRFPATNGQMFADIAGLLRTIGGRNL